MISNFYENEYIVYNIYIKFKFGIIWCGGGVSRVVIRKRITPNTSKHIYEPTKNKELYYAVRLCPLLLNVYSNILMYDCRFSDA